MTASRPPHPWWLALGRAVNAAFFMMTAVYCILTYSPFAYEQFIQPNMLAWLSNFVFLHADFYWLALCVTMLTLAPYLRIPRTRLLGWAYLCVSAVVGVLLFFVRVLPGGDEPRLSIAIAIASLAPIVWLALLDHLASAPPTTTARIEATRLLTICLTTAVVVWAIYATAAPIRLRAAGGLAFSWRQLLVGAGVSAVAHLTLFTILFLMLTLVGRGARIAAGGALAILLQRVVFVPISIAGPVSWVMAFALASAVVLLVSGVARSFAGRSSSRALPILSLALLPPAAFASMLALTTFDWGFMLQKLSALLAAIVAFAAVRALVGPAVPAEKPRLPGRAVIVVPLGVLAVYAASVIAVPRLPRWFDDARLHPDFALDAYAAGDPSFRLIRQFLDTDRALQSDADFYAYLRANSSIKDPISPVSVDFVSKLSRPAERPPHIFLFIIDSLRRDYVSPYNSAVTFTPRLAAFAGDSVVFDRAFSRYGGTGLAVPSIWAGAMVAHKQYVTPFAPMNALGKLLDAGGYRRVVTRDHITEELFGLSGGTTLLDRHVPEMMHTFCGTMDELGEDLQTHAGDPRPIFAHTRPLDLHIGNTRLASVPAGESYPGFFGPYAARVRRIDACFGAFVDGLKRAHLYDDSIIVVMSDHGDSLGEGLRWGHGYTVVPEVMRIPLLIRLPTALRERFVADVSRVAFGTDVTPTLYQLLGYQPERPRVVAGVPLFSDAPDPPASRRRESFLVASSYGAVYGIIRHNGRRLYIADAIEGRDYLYDLSPAAGDARIGMTDADRLANRALIREHVADLAAWYGLQHP